MPGRANDHFSRQPRPPEPGEEIVEVVEVVEAPVPPPEPGSRTPPARATGVDRASARSRCGTSAGSPSRWCAATAGTRTSSSRAPTRYWRSSSACTSSTPCWSPRRRCGASRTSRTASAARRSSRASTSAATAAARLPRRRPCSPASTAASRFPRMSTSARSAGTRPRAEDYEPAAEGVDETMVRPSPPDEGTQGQQ